MAQEMGRRFAARLVKVLQARLDPRLEGAGTSPLAHVRDVHEFSSFAVAPVEFEGRDRLLDPDATARGLNPSDPAAASISAGR
jgi:hypothetical protein